MANRKASLYFPQEIREQIQAEATRLDRSLSWLLRQAWMLAREEVASAPAPLRHKVRREDDRRRGCNAKDDHNRAQSA